MYKITLYTTKIGEERKVVGGLSYLEAQGFLKILFTELTKAMPIAYARLDEDYAVIRLSDSESCFYYEIETEETTA